MGNCGNDYYSRIAGGYDELHGAEQDAKLMEFLDKTALGPHMRLLDVGCGTGRSSIVLSRHHVEWHGIEPAPGLIAQAPDETKRRIIQAGAESIPFPDAHFDIVLSLTALQNFTDPALGLKEMARVAKPAATILVSFIKKSPRHALLDRLIREEFVVVAHWEQQQDLMYIAKPSKRI